MTHTTKKLGELCKIKTGKRDANHGNPNGEYHFFTCAEQHSYIDTYSFDTEAILVAGNGDVGACKYFKGKFDAYQRTYVLYDFTQEIDVQFLYIFLNSFLKTAAQKAKQGGTMPYIKLGLLSNFEIPMPPMGDQRKIVARIEKQFAKIDEATRLRAESEKLGGELLPAALHEIFSSVESKGWKAKPLGDLIKLSSGSFLPSSMQVAGTYKIYGGNGVLGTHSKFNSENRTVVIGRVGAYCGAVHITEPKSWITDNALMVTDISKEIDLEFLAVILRYKNLNQYAKKSAQPSLSQTAINNTEIPLPPLRVQKAIVKKFDALATKARALCDLQSTQSADLKSLKQSILHEAFSSDIP